MTIRQIIANRLGMFKTLQPKKIIMRKTVIGVTALLISVITFGQMPGGGGNRGMAQQMNGGFYGKVIDSITGKPLEAASVQLVQSKYDTVAKKRKEVVIGGMLTKNNGEFNLESVPVLGQYKLKISAIGFKSYERNVSLIDPKSFRSNGNNGNQDVTTLLG